MAAKESPMMLHAVEEFIDCPHRAEQLMLSRRASGQVRVLDGDRLRLRVSHGSLPSMHFWNGSSPVEFELRYPESADQYLIHFPGSGRLTVHLKDGGQASDEHVGVIASMRDITHIHLEAGRSGTAMSLSRKRLVERLSARLRTQVKSELIFDRTFRIEAGSVGSLKNLVDSLLKPGMASLVDHSIFATRSLSCLVQDIVLDNFQNNYSFALKNAESIDIPCFLLDAEAFLQGLSNINDVSPADIARKVSVSVRKLQYAFQSYRSCTPIAYIRRERLNRAKNILEVDSNISIAELSKAQGFSNVTRFKREFQEQFGETPAQMRSRLKLG